MWQPTLTLDDPPLEGKAATSEGMLGNFDKNSLASLD
jgi:hypothetical protein